MSKKSIYLVANYFARPKAHVNTSQKGWMENPNNIQYDEQVAISRGLKQRDVTAKIVLNLTEKRVERNGWNEHREFDPLFKYFFSGYHQYVTEVMTQLDAEYFNKMLDEMQAEINKQETEIVVDTPAEAAP